MSAYEPGPGYTPPPVMIGDRKAVRFDVISDGFRLLGQQMGTWVLAMLVCLAASIIVLVVFYTSVFVSLMPMIFSPNSGAAAATAVGLIILVYLVFLVVQTGLSAFLLGGLYNMAIRQVRGGQISVNDLFGARDSIWKLVGASLLIGVLANLVQFVGYIPALMAGGLNAFNTQGSSSSGAGVLVLLGNLIGVCVAMVFYLLTLLTWPLIVEQKREVIDAIRTSIDALKGEWLTVLGIMVVLGIINILAAIPCLIGLLFTVPASYLALTVLYCDVFPLEPTIGGMEPLSPVSPPPLSGNW